MMSFWPVGLDMSSIGKDFKNLKKISKSFLLRI